MEGDVSCHTCRRLRGTTPRGEVRYDTDWLCLPCHLMERELQQMLKYKAKVKGTIERVFQPCGRYRIDSAVAGDCTRTPAWFCYDCHQYLCTQCEQAVHMDLMDHVSLSLSKNKINT